MGVEGKTEYRVMETHVSFFVSQTWRRIKKEAFWYGKKRII
jgi:hypothetical protein